MLFFYKICILVIKFTYFNFILDYLYCNKNYLYYNRDKEISIEIEKIFKHILIIYLYLYIYRISKINVDYFHFHI